MNSKILIIFSAFTLCACASTSDEVTERWTDEHLANSPAQQAPVYIERSVQSPAERQDLARQADALVEKRDDVLGAGLELEDISGDTETYTAEARKRAVPPQR